MLTELVEISLHSCVQLQCNLYGHYSLDGSLSLLILPTLNTSLDILVSSSSYLTPGPVDSLPFTLNMSALYPFFPPPQIDTCNQEAVKLATFINNHTPMLASDPYLSHLVAASVQTATVREVKGGSIGYSTTPSPGAISAATRLSLNLPLALLVAVMAVLLRLR